MIDARAQMVQQRARQFLMGDPEEQSSMMADAYSQLQAEQMGGMPEELPEEGKYADMEAELDEEAPTEEE